MSTQIDLVGQRFGRWLVTGPREVRSAGAVYWTCRCDCGNVKAIFHGNLRSGKTTSCGCHAYELTAARSARHDGAHRGRVTVEYRLWLSMRSRCRNPANHSYPDYGGRGIEVCERWDDFANFLADMGPRPSPKHSIERAANDGPYEPGNCRWATKTEQANNTRRNRNLAHAGQVHTIAEWARLTGIPQSAIRQRLRVLGWSVERALTEPVAVQRRRSVA